MTFNSSKAQEDVLNFGSIKIRKDKNSANNLISLDVKNCVLSFYAAFAFLVKNNRMNYKKN
jgi:hypothetical protein